MTRGFTRLILLLAVAASVALAGCTEDDDGGGDDDPGLNTSNTNASVEGGANVTVDTTPTVDLAVRTTGTYPLDPGYDVSPASIPAGAEVNVTFSNADPNPIAPHDWVLEGVSGAQTDAIMSGDETSVTFTAPEEPGDYTYFCSVGDHRDRGMEGTLTVTA